MSGPTPPFVLEASALGVAGVGAADAPFFEGVSLRLGAGEILSLLGRERAGGAALAATLAGFPPAPIEGTFRLGTLVGGRAPRIAYLPNGGTLAPHASAAGQLARALAGRQNIPLGSAREELRLALERVEGAPPLAKLKARPPLIPPLELSLALVAVALAQEPDAVIADDPARGLDPIETLGFVRRLAHEQMTRRFALLYATGDPSIALRLGGRAIVLREGRVVEEGPVTKLSSNWTHSFTQSLFAAMPKLDLAAPPRPAPRAEPVLQVRSFAYVKTRRFNPSTGITFDLRRGAGLALVGRRGSGRRSLARAVLGLAPLRQGRIVFDSVDVGTLSSVMRGHLRRRVVFLTGEDDVLDPRMSVRDTVAEPLRTHLNLGATQNEHTIAAALKRVGLGDIAQGLRPGELDGLDKRRLQIARAIAATPSLAVLYEPLLGLDAIGASLVLELLKDYRAKSAVAFLTVTADFAVAQALAEDVIVMKDRTVVERGPIAEVVKNPQDPYTRALIEAALPARPRTLPPAASRG